MKTYFAKYLPVDEKIDEGDLFLYDGELKTYYMTSHEFICMETTLGVQGVPKKLCKKVKLFLCSRDIKVGDKFDSANGSNFICTNTSPTKIYSNGGLHSAIEEVGHSKEYAYKVIGYISPNSKWVKEGDEFDIDQVCLSPFHDAGEIYPVPIKCPHCNTYN